MNRKPRAAFICTHNSCRSQIAEALGRYLAGDVFESCSGGTEKAERLNPDAFHRRKNQGFEKENTGRRNSFLTGRIRKGYFIGPSDEFSGCMLRMAEGFSGMLFQDVSGGGSSRGYLEKRILRRYNETIVYEGIIRAGYGACSAEEHFTQRISAGWMS